MYTNIKMTMMTAKSEAIPPTGMIGSSVGDVEESASLVAIP